MDAIKEAPKEVTLAITIWAALAITFQSIVCSSLSVKKALFEPVYVQRFIPDSAPQF